MSATRTDLTITSTSHNDANKKVTNKVSYVNPNITNQQAVTLANMFVDLTKDNYYSTTRTDTTNCDTAVTRPITSIKVTERSGSSSTYVDLPSNGIIDIPVNILPQQPSIYIKTPYDVVPVVSMVDDTTGLSFEWSQSMYISPNKGLTIEKASWMIKISTASSSTPAVGTIIKFNVQFAATSQYDSWSKDITFNITAEQE